MLARTIAILGAGMSVAISHVMAGDWPQFRGPDHNGIAPPGSIAKTWPKEGPAVVWKVPVGESFGSFAIATGRVCLFVERLGNEVCIALDDATGKERWATTIDKTIFENQGGNGPRSTPVIDGDRVYVLGTYLKLACLDAHTGKIVWTHDIKSEFGGQEPHWGNAASPVIDGDQVFVCGGGAGQSLLAFNKKTGAVLWKRHDEKLTHATPTPATIHGIRQLIFFTQSGLVSVAPPTGDVLWRYPFPYRTSTAASPVVGDDIVYCAAGYGNGSGAVRISQKDNVLAATEIWRSPSDQQSHWMTPVYYQGHLYGLFGFRDVKRAPLKCLAMASGAEKWAEAGFGQGGVILADGHVIVQGDQGQLGLVAATPDGYKESARAQPLGGKCWTMPAFSNGRIYTRSTTEAICLDVAATGDAKNR